MSSADLPSSDLSDPDLAATLEPGLILLHVYTTTTSELIVDMRTL